MGSERHLWKKLISDRVQAHGGDIENRARTPQTDVLAASRFVHSQMLLARLYAVRLARVALALHKSSLNFDVPQYISCGWHKL
jgi:hypothetical protein